MENKKDTITNIKNKVKKISKESNKKLKEVKRKTTKKITDLKKEKKQKSQLKKENSVKNKLKIKDWSEMTVEQMPQFIESISKLDHETALKIMNQLSDWKNMSEGMISELITLYDKVITENSKSANESIAAYRLVLDSLNEQVKEPSISDERKQVLNNQMIDLAIRIDQKDTEKAKRNMELVLNGTLLAGTLFIGGAIYIVTNGKVSPEKALEKISEKK